MSSYTVRRDEGLGGQWLEVWHQPSSYANPWGVSQNLILWEPLLWQGIPAGKWLPHPCNGHSRGPPPLDLQWRQGNTHASLLPTLSSQWVTGPQTDGQCVFWVVLGHILAVCKWLLGQFKEVTYCGRLIAQWCVCYHLCLWGDGMFCCFSTRKGHKWPVMSSIMYLMESTTPCGLLFFSTWNIPINSACPMWPLKFTSERVSCRQALIITFIYFNWSSLTLHVTGLGSFIPWIRLFFLSFWWAGIGDLIMVRVSLNTSS